MIIGAGKYKQQAGRLKIPVGVAISVLTPKAAYRQNSFFSRSPQCFLLSPSTDWMRPIYIVESNLLYSKVDSKCPDLNTYNV